MGGIWKFDAASKFISSLRNQLRRLTDVEVIGMRVELYPAKTFSHPRQPTSWECL
jgi:hypothetical protein